MVATPFTHHDSPTDPQPSQHCTACAASAIGTSPQAVLMPGRWLLRDAGAAVSVILISDGAQLSVRTTGRSPPSAL